jgi:hypothetical protein
VLVLKGRSFGCAAKSNPIKRGVKPHWNSRGGKGVFQQTVKAIADCTTVPLKRYPDTNPLTSEIWDVIALFTFS